MDSITTVVIFPDADTYVEDVHPLLTADNILATAPDNVVADSMYTIEPWSIETLGEDRKIPAGTIFSVPDINKVPQSRMRDTIFYRAKRDFIPLEILKEILGPGLVCDLSKVAPDYIERVTSFVWYLQKLLYNGIRKTVENFISVKQLARESRPLLEYKWAYDGVASLKRTTPNRGKWVGWEITPLRAKGIAVRLDRVTFQRAALVESPGQTSVGTFYLYHSGSPLPLYKFSTYGSGAFSDVMKLQAVVLKPGSASSNPNGNYETVRGGVWLNFDDTIGPQVAGKDYGDDDIIYSDFGYDTKSRYDFSPGGCWYLVYKQPEEGFRDWEAVDYGRDWATPPCSACNRSHFEAWRYMSKFLQIRSIELDDAPAGGIDPARVKYTRGVSYGLNALFSVMCDLTDFICRQADMFVPVIQKQVAVDLLRAMALNPYTRVNRNQMNVTRDEILYEIDGNTTGRKTGLAAELERAYEALQLDTSGISRECLACKNGGVRYTHT